MRLFGFGSHFECKICGKNAKVMDIKQDKFCNRHKNLAVIKGGGRIITTTKVKKCQFCGSTDLLPSEHSPSVIVCHNCDEVQQK